MHAKRDYCHDDHISRQPHLRERSSQGCGRYRPQMSVSETTGSPQHKLHWLAEQALSWSELPVVTVRPTVFPEGFFLQLTAAGGGR